MDPAHSNTALPPLDPVATRLDRRLGLFDAVTIGLSSMIGAGIFSAVAPAAAAAGSGLLIGLLVAAGLAFLNASSVAQLAAIYPEAGGTYVYARKRLGGLWGFLAGWAFVIGKLASCTAMALTFGHYAFPSHPFEAGAAAVLILSLINALGVKKTARVTQVLLRLVLLTLFIVVFAALGGGGVDPSHLTVWHVPNGPLGILQSAGLLFFAFAGYARVATLGEEVAHPRITIPKAMLISLSLTLLVYVCVMITVLVCVDMDVLATSRDWL